ncbi:unnamed protein product [Prorocentrum cordatum]|uniref:Uncharacterized protein n=1 Tax=Prorocentrum cordatum TaxID=2364126 RepID=A0ABN9T7N5_9DINO|nr:unnamed protein product [Polarella glacialis]
MQWHRSEALYEWMTIAQSKEEVLAGIPFSNQCRFLDFFGQPAVEVKHARRDAQDILLPLLFISIIFVSAYLRGHVTIAVELHSSAPRHCRVASAINDSVLASHARACRPNRGHPSGGGADGGNEGRLDRTCSH